MREHFMGQGDLLPEIYADLTDGNGNPLDLTTATAVLFYMDLETGAHKIDGVPGAVVGDPTLGRVRYVWTGTDTDTSGVHRAQFRVTFPTALPASFPNDDYIYVWITPKVGS
ncbi:MAG TPA: BppU family phage baseplate upper protein [Thermoanaerobaculia bacterium]|nr:BppU family phage baseplate upper protein [Thermoanaerobaculia bacterium]